MMLKRNKIQLSQIYQRGKQMIIFRFSPMNCSTHSLGTSQISGLPGDCPFLLGWAGWDFFSLSLKQSPFLTEFLGQRSNSKVCQ